MGMILFSQHYGERWCLRRNLAVVEVQVVNTKKATEKKKYNITKEPKRSDIGINSSKCAEQKSKRMDTM